MSDSGTCCGGGCGEASGKDASVGVQNPWVIDAIEGAGERVILKMFETRAWSEAFDRMFQLQEKFNAYMAFILDGEMRADFPGLVGRPVRVVLECSDYPPDSVVDFLQKVREQMLLMDIDLEVDVRGGATGGTECSQPADDVAGRASSGSCGCGPEGCGQR
jgi:hypothetical protein